MNQPLKKAQLTTLNAAVAFQDLGGWILGESSAPESRIIIPKFDALESRPAKTFTPFALIYPLYTSGLTQ